MNDNEPAEAASEGNDGQRRASLFNRFRTRKEAATEQTNMKGGSPQDSSSMFSSNSTHSHFPLLGRRSSVQSEEARKKKKEGKRESMSERGAFRVVTDENGFSYTMENRDWPPGTYSKVSARRLELLSQNGKLGDFYDNQGAIAPGGDIANVGPDPDWVPGLTEEERDKLKKIKSGRYVF